MCAVTFSVTLQKPLETREGQLEYPGRNVFSQQAEDLVKDDVQEFGVSMNGRRAPFSGLTPNDVHVEVTFQDAGRLFQELFIGGKAEKAVLSFSNGATFGKKEADEPKDIVCDPKAVRQGDVRAGFEHANLCILRNRNPELSDDRKGQKGKAAVLV
jgi:hypothetical protein